MYIQAWGRTAALHRSSYQTFVLFHTLKTCMNAQKCRDAALCPAGGERCWIEDRGGPPRRPNEGSGEPPRPPGGAHHAPRPGGWCPAVGAACGDRRERYRFREWAI